MVHFFPLQLVFYGTLISDVKPQGVSGQVSLGKSDLPGLSLRKPHCISHSPGSSAVNKHALFLFFPSFSQMSVLNSYFTQDLLPSWRALDLRTLCGTP